MTESKFDDTKAVAHMPNVDIEIFHRRPWNGNEEILTITLRAVPSFAAFFRTVEAANPFLFWMRAVETAWAPWTRLAEAAKPPQLTEEPPTSSSK